MNNRNIIVVGASAGGFDALKRLVNDLPANLRAAVFIVWHLPEDAEGILPDVLNRIGKLPCKTAVDLEPIQLGRIYVAPPDRHLLIEDGRVRVTRGPKENRFRPAIDPLFRSAAYAYGTLVIGVILSGALDDGTAGLWVIGQRGGIAIVQDPAEASIAAMPQSAKRSALAQNILSIKEIGPRLVALTREDVVNHQKKDSPVHINTDRSKRNSLIGEFTPFTCPECHDDLSIINEGTNRFNCPSGHTFSADSLLMAINENIEANLWNTLRNLHESIFLMNQMGDHFAELNERTIAANYFKQAKEAHRHTELLNRLITENERIPYNTMHAPIVE